MKRCTSLLWVLTALALCGVSFSVHAEEPKGSPAESKSKSPDETPAKNQAQEQVASGKPATGNAPEAQQPQTDSDHKQTGAKDNPPNQEAKAEKQAESRFVDRDGDGLRDGQEHRFRGRHRRGAERGRENAEQQRVRSRKRNGADNSTGQRRRGQ